MKFVSKIQTSCSLRRHASALFLTRYVGVALLVFVRLLSSYNNPPRRDCRGKYSRSRVYFKLFSPGGDHPAAPRPAHHLLPEEFTALRDFEENLRHMVDAEMASTARQTPFASPPLEVMASAEKLSEKRDMLGLPLSGSAGVSERATLEKEIREHLTKQTNSAPRRLLRKLASVVFEPTLKNALDKADAHVQVQIEEASNFSVLNTYGLSGEFQAGMFEVLEMVKKLERLDELNAAMGMGDRGRSWGRAASAGDGIVSTMTVEERAELRTELMKIEKIQRDLQKQFPGEIGVPGGAAVASGAAQPVLGSAFFDPCMANYPEALLKKAIPQLRRWLQGEMYSDF